MSYPYGSNTQMQIMQATQQLENLKKQQQLEQYQMQQMQQYQQPVAQPQPQQQMQPQEQLSNANWIPVDSIDEVTSIVVGQGQSRWFMFKSTSVMGIKTVDNLGMPKVSYYKFEEFDPYAQQKQEVQPTQPQVDLTGYVKEDVVKVLEEKIELLELEIEELKTKTVDVVKPQTVKTTRKEVTNNG